MSLINELKAVNARLIKIKSAQAEVTEAQRLGELRTTLETAREDIEALVMTLSLLRSNKIAVTGLSIDNALAKLAQASEKFQAQPVSGTLRTGARWTQLTASLEAAAKNISDRTDVSWKEFLTTLFSGHPPNILEMQLTKTPSNMAALEQYRTRYAKFMALRDAPPSTQIALDQLLSHSKALGEINFQRDVPDNVRDFFEAAAISAGFPLANLTDPVLDWLRKNKLIGRYVVRQRPQ